MNPSTDIRILKILLGSEIPISGQVLSENLGLSRNAVWKGIEKLKKQGLEIKAVKGRGYLLQTRDEPLGQSLIEAALTTNWLGLPVHFHRETDSTNLRAKVLALSGARSGTLVVADHQTSGRGRLDRRWEAEPGTNLLFSLILRPALELTAFFRLTMAASVSLCQAVDKITGLESRVKWPNDVYLEGLKLAGVLTEIAGQAQAMDWAVIGIGLNVNDCPRQMKATCLAQVVGRPVSRLAVLDAFLTNFEAVIDQGFESQSIVDKWKLRSMTLGRVVDVVDGRERISGLAKDIDGQGALIVVTEDGPRRVVCGDLDPVG